MRVHFLYNQLGLNEMRVCLKGWSMFMSFSAVFSGECWKNGLANREVEPHHWQLSIKTSKAKVLNLYSLKFLVLRASPSDTIIKILLEMMAFPLKIK